MTRLADFLRARREPIPAEWEAFARASAPSGASMAVEALRDHAAYMLDAFAADLAAAQTPRGSARRWGTSSAMRCRTAAPGRRR